MKRAVLYLRVSTQDQTTANQERELRQVAERAGWEIVHVYSDHGISGAKSKDKRPAFNALHKAAARREFDVVMAWSVDRLGRSLQDLVGFLVGNPRRWRRSLPAPAGHRHHDAGRQGNVSDARCLRRVRAVDHSRAGPRRASPGRSEGKTLGRPRIAADVEARILAALKARKDTGDTVRKIAARFGIDPSTVQRISRPLGESVAVA